MTRSQGRNSPSTQIRRLGGVVGTDRECVRDGRSGPEGAMAGRLGHGSWPGKLGTTSEVPPMPLRGHLDDGASSTDPGRLS